MGEVANVGTRARDDLAVGLNQRVGFARERRHLDREAAFEPLGGARADRSQAGRDAIERRQAEADLERRDQQKHDTEDGKSRDQRAVEAARFVVDLDSVAGDRHQKSPLVAEVDGALDQPQVLLFRALHIALTGADRAR